MNQQDTNNQSTLLEDLAAQNADELKGGPKKIFIGGLSAKESATPIADLEPTGDVVGGLVASARDANLFSFHNHNETISKDNEAEEAVTKRLTDLAVDEETEAEIKGGTATVRLLTSVQYPYK